MFDFFEFSNEMLCLADDRGYFIRVNPAWTKTLGWSAEELTSRPFVDFVHPDDRDATIQEATLLRDADHETIRFENRYRCHDGTYRWLAWRCVRDPVNRHLVATARDVTEQRVQAEAIRASEERFRRLATSAPIGIAQTDAVGNLFFANSKWCELAGVTSDEAKGSSWQLFVHPEDRPDVLRKWQANLQAGSDLAALEFRFLHKNGEVRWVSTSVAMLKDAAGAVVSHIATLEDITERKAIGDALRESEERFRAFMNHSPAIAWAKDEFGRYVYLNKTYEDEFQVRLDDWRGKTDFQVWPAEVARVFRENDLIVLANGKPLRMTEEFLPVEDERHHWLSTKFLFEDNHGRRYVGGIGVEITELMRIEQALRSKQELLEELNRNLESRVELRTRELAETNEKLRIEFHERVRAEEKLQQQLMQVAHVSRLTTIGEMAAELAHEIMQPLSAIGNYIYGTLHRLKVGDVVTDDLIAMLSQLETESGRATNIIRRVRNFTRRSEPQRNIASLNELVSGVVRLLSTEARHRNIEIRVDLDASLPTTFVDSLQIEQVTVNLVRNAFDALQDVHCDSPVVTLETRYWGDTVEVAVCDNGPGIAEEQRASIFEPYFTTKADGLGLGLAISKSIVEAHQGRLWSEPRTPRGTTFRMAFPLTSAPHRY